MRFSPSLSLTAVAAALVLAADRPLPAAERTFTLPPETARLKPGPGADLAAGQCLLCHSADYISTQPKLSQAVWQAEITKMVQKYGAPIPTNNVPALLEYLVKNYGVAPTPAPAAPAAAPAPAAK